MTGIVVRQDATDLPGWLASEWRRSATNRRVKLYRLTAQGRRQLRAELDRWDQFSAAVSRVLKSGPSPVE